MYVCAYIYIYECVYVYVYVYMCVCVCICVYVCVCVCVWFLSVSVFVLLQFVQDRVFAQLMVMFYLHNQHSVGLHKIYATSYLVEARQTYSNITYIHSHNTRIILYVLAKKSSSREFKRMLGQLNLCKYVLAV